MSANDNEDYSNDSHENDVITAEFVQSTMQLIRAEAIDSNAFQQCSRDLQQFEQQLSNEVAVSKVIPILCTLGITNSRAQEIAASTKKITPLKEWIKSIKQYFHSKRNNARATYKFPYGFWTAKEDEIELRKRIGLRALKTKPKKKMDRIQILHHLDDHPDEATSREQQDEEIGDLRYAILNGAVSRAFLRPLEGDEKKEAKLGHQNEKPYLRQYYYDGKAGIVPGVSLCEVRECGLAMKTGRPYIRDSADALGFELLDDEEIYADDNEYYDAIKSHPVECKCRCGKGSDGTLAQAIKIQKKIAALGGLDYQRRLDTGLAVYTQVSSSQHQFIAELIPKASERIQVLHHAYTYGANKTMFLVGNSAGKVIYGVMVKFDEQLLESYGQSTDYLYNNGLNIFYESNPSDLPISSIKSVLLSDDKLKKKYTIDDFMTSWLIWRELLPANDSPHKFPLPECNMLIPWDHAMWNSSKGGSDTVTGFCYKNQVILPIRSPQTAVVARFIMLFAVLNHRMAQSVTGTKEPDIEKDTIRTVRERNNKRLPFHKSLQFITENLLERCQVQRPTQNQSVPLQQPAPRFNKKNKKSRHDKDHNVLAQSGTTGVSPHGRGKANNAKFGTDQFRLRCAGCTGHPIRIAKRQKKRGKDDKIGLFRSPCALCDNRTSHMCFNCKQSLCFNEDRSEEIKELLQTNPEKIKRVAPALEPFISKRDTPAHWREIGMFGMQEIYTSMSCFHFCHPEYLTLRKTDGSDSTDEDEDTLVSSITSRSGLSSPTL